MLRRGALFGPRRRNRPRESAMEMAMTRSLWIIILTATCLAAAPGRAQTTQPADPLPPLPQAGQTPPTLPGDAPASQPEPVPGEPGGTRIDPATMTIEALVDTARRLLEVGNQESIRRSIQLVEIALRREPRHLEALGLMAEIHDVLNDVHTAREYYLKVLADNRADFRANLGIGRIHIRSKLWRQAVPYLETALAGAPPEKRLETLVLLSRGYQGRGDRTQAVEIAREAVKLEGNTFGAWDVLISSLSELGDFDGAAREAQRLEQLATERVRADRLNTDLLQYLGAAYELRSKTLRELHRRNHLMMNSAGQPVAELRPGTNAEAARTLAELVELALKQSELAAILERHRALPLAEKAVEYEPENAANYVLLGKLQFDIGDHAKAAEQFRRALDLDPGNSEAQHYLSTLQGAAAAGR